MKRILATAFLPVLVGLGAVAFAGAPATANGATPITVNELAPNWDVTFDCTAGNASLNFPYSPGATMTVHLTNCVSSVWAYRVDDTIADTYPGGITFSDGTHIAAIADNYGTSMTTMTLDPNTSFSTIDGAGANNLSLRFGVVDTVFDNPSGSLLSTSDLTIPINAPAFTADVTVLGNNPIGGIADCMVDAGDHVYGTNTITVPVAGDYTFRVVATTPNTTPGYSNSTVDTIEANGLALYSTFDETAIGEDLIACQTNGGINTTARDYVGTQTGYSLSPYYSSISATLQPGTYTLVGFTTASWSSASWAAGEQNGGLPIDESLIVETWGPTPPAPVLANTGRDSGLDVMLGAATIAMVALGGLLIAVRRRRG